MPATPTHSVYLVVSKFGGVSKATAYHSSVMVDGREYSFGMAGICFSSEGPTSHCSTPRLILMGTSSYSGYDLLVAVSDQFGQGTYDLIRKNCNSWTDVALFFLLRQRLDQQYRALERIGSRRPSFVQAISIGKYTPNPLAANFDLEQAVARVAADTAWPAPATALPGEAPCEEADCHSFFDDAASTAPSACGDPPQATSEEGTASVQSQGADLAI
mmetsp:Transcript_1975/g.5762  ORF Transcript_1975/g.5762 Transcript_1975/m.5762 type:complete len:216 (+) Transcript_1975:85-732(+)